VGCPYVHCTNCASNKPVKMSLRTSIEQQKSPVRVCITGAAGQIGYSLVFLIAKGEMFGQDQPLILHLLDIPQMEGVLHGVVMEIEDCAYPLVRGVVPTSKLEEAFKGIDYCLMVGAMPRKEGMERSDLLKANVGIFKEQGRALAEHAKKEVKVVVVGNPANTNALICAAAAKTLDKKNFSCLTRLDQNRATSLIARRLNCTVDQVHNVIVWGNHSSTQYPDVNHAVVRGYPFPQSETPVRASVADDEWIQTEFISTVQQRGAKVIAARKLSSAASAAQAIVDHMRDWVKGTGEGRFVSMGVVSDGSYGIPEGLMYSFPVTTCRGSYTIVQGLDIDPFSRAKMDASADELLKEKEEAFAFLGDV